MALGLGEPQKKMKAVVPPKRNGNFLYLFYYIVLDIFEVEILIIFL